MPATKYKIGDRSGFLEITQLIIDRSKFRRPRTTALCICHRCNRSNFQILPYNFAKQKSCGCNRAWHPQPIGSASKLFKGYKEMPSLFWNKAKKRAIKKKLEFDLTQEFLWDLYEKQYRKCALSGLPIEFRKGDKNTTSTASIDRIDSQKGYTTSNVQWVHKDINLMKNILKTDYFIDLCQKVYQQRAGHSISQ